MKLSGANFYNITSYANEKLVFGPTFNKDFFFALSNRYFS